MTNLKFFASMMHQQCHSHIGFVFLQFSPCSGRFFNLIHNMIFQDVGTLALAFTFITSSVAQYDASWTAFLSASL